MYDWVTLLYSRNGRNIVNQPYFNKEVSKNPNERKFLNTEKKLINDLTLHYHTQK